jgi:hypothetical protein
MRSAQARQQSWLIADDWLGLDAGLCCAVLSASGGAVHQHNITCEQIEKQIQAIHAQIRACMHGVLRSA